MLPRPPAKMAAMHQRSKGLKGSRFLENSQMMPTVNTTKITANSHRIPWNEEKAAPVFCT